MVECFIRINFCVQINREFLDSFIVLFYLLDDDLISVVSSGSQVNLSKSPLLS